jgi:hypothetical protein
MTTLVGALAGRGRARVDAHGGIGAIGESWSLDWWIGADDRWHVPAREAAVSQRRVDAAPVVETSMRVPGGDAIHRAYGVRDASGGDLLVVEIENATAIPFAVALALRPYGPTSMVAVERIALAGEQVTVDGRVAVVLPKPPARAVASTLAEGDAAVVVFGGDAPVSTSFDVRCVDGGANAALVYPLPHTAVLRVVLPLATRESPVFTPTASPSAVQVASGWAAQARQGAAFEVPEGRLADAVDACRRAVLLAAEGFGDRGEPDGAPAALDRARVALALDRWGFGDEAATLLAGLASAGEDDELVPASGRGDADGAALHAVAEHVRLAADDALLDALAPAIAGAAHRIRRLAGGSRLRRRTTLGLLPAGEQPAWSTAGPFDRDTLWAWRGLRDAAELLARGHHAAAAEAARVDAAALADALRHLVGPAGPAPPPQVGDLVAVELDLVAGDHPLASAAIEVGRASLVDGLVRAPAAPELESPELTLLLGQAELRAVDPRALGRLDAVVGRASPTWTWPELLDPATGEGARGAGDHLVTAASLLAFVRDLFVREHDAGLDLLSVFPPAWRGQSLDVRDAPTRFGRLAYAVRWHGERPALLWDLAPHDGVTDLNLRVPGVDVRWVGSGLRGEALLDPAPPTAAAPRAGESFR